MAGRSSNHSGDESIQTTPTIAVIVATCDRPELLASRSIPSILNQSKPPELLIIVDDSRSAKNQRKNAAYIESLKSDTTTISFVRNRRTPGACGAWNTGIDGVFEQVMSPENTYLAILDDDDYWQPTYLAKCIKLASTGSYDLVAADLSRIEDLNAPPLEDPGPAVLNAEDFLVGNPGIQGSNLFVRLSTMLMAGCFDESIRSSTDRDLCIRIADLSAIRFARLPEALVVHYAEPERARLTTRGSEAKLSGLDVFWCKYAGRMTPSQRRTFCERSVRLFQWIPPTNEDAFFDPPKVERIAIVLGLMSSNPNLNMLSKDSDGRIVGLDVILYESYQDRNFDDKVAALRNAGIGCYPLGSALQKGIGIEPVKALELYCSAVAGTRIGTEVWIADEHPRKHAPIKLLVDLKARHYLTKNTSPISDKITNEISAARIETAKVRITTNYDCHNLRLLGSGSEAVVFTDGVIVYKCIDYWKTRLPKEQLSFLQSKIGAWDKFPGLYSLQKVDADGSWAILTYEFEPSAPFKGGHEEGLLELLESCRSAKIVCNNIHPKNLILTNAGVRLIDYGSDIRPFTELAFEHMARRAYLSCYHSDHPHLSELMRTSLSDITFVEMSGYSEFRTKIKAHLNTFQRPYSTAWKAPKAPVHPDFQLVVGVITSEPKTVWPLLQSFSLQKIEAKFLLLDNNCQIQELEDLMTKAAKIGLNVVVFDLVRQQRDANQGLFGSSFDHRPFGKVGIAQARSMIQRYLGQEIESDSTAVGWLLDDDMRVDDRAKKYLRWLPVLRADGVDVVLGSYEGSSPNPPLNGLRVQLVDLVLNLQWLNGLLPEQLLPNRSEENRRARIEYPDYYYDLSRKHTAHLEQPHWVEPVIASETVREARLRLLHEANRIMSGAPLTRPLASTTPLNPLQDALESVNRGGCTFILNPDALINTPNMIVKIQGKEARRSDMLWAIVNRYYRKLVIKSVGFPVLHEVRESSSKELDFHKVQGEIVGSAMYAGLTSFLAEHPHHSLEFNENELKQLESRCQKYLQDRLNRLRKSFYRIRGLTGTLTGLHDADYLSSLILQLEQWFTYDNWQQLFTGVTSLEESDLRKFVTSLRTLADDYARAATNEL